MIMGPVFLLKNLFLYRFPINTWLIPREEKTVMLKNEKKNDPFIETQLLSIYICKKYYK